MHKVAARPRMFPYYDMVRWALDHVDIPTRTIVNEQRVTIGTFRPKQLQAMYKLPTVSYFVYNAEFLENFKQKECVQYDKSMSGLIKDWGSHPTKFRVNSNGVYTISSLEPQFKYVALMTCRLYQREDTTHFFLQWVPLIHTVAEDCSFDWDKLLSDSLKSRVTEYRAQKESGKIASFFMFAYIMDAVCFLTPFPLMSWIWNPSEAEPIHVYHSKLWENKASDFVYEIFNWVMVSLHVTIFGHLPPKISDTIMVNLSSIADWYVEAEFSYLRIFGASVPLHALPLFIPNRLACRKISRQTVISGVSKELKGYYKNLWPPFPIHLNSYSLLDFGHAKAEAVALEDLKLVHVKFKKNDPHRVLSNHLANCGLKRFEHENSPSDDIFWGTRSYAEVLAWIQALEPEERANVLKFQEHWQSCLPLVLRGENPITTEVQKKEAEGCKDSTPRQEEHQDREEQTGSPKPEMKTPDPPKKPTPVATPGQSAKQIRKPIASITPLQSTKGNIDTGCIFNEELRPIRMEELPPNEFFFDKKRKVVVKREFYQEAGSTTK
jgi:hypothetical protein